MELIENNPYRVAGILSNATERELQKQKTKIKAFSKVGKEIKSDYDFNILNKLNRTEDSIDKAFSNIEQNQDKIYYSLFWFLNTSPFDNTAIEYLKNGDEEKAVEIWEKVTQNKEVGAKNFSAFNNLGTFKLLSQSKEEIKEGIETKIKLIESDYFESFVHAVADETFRIDNEKQVEILIDALLMHFKNHYSSSETIQLFSNCNGSSQKYLSKKFTEEPIHKIESQIESTKRKRKDNKASAYEFGLGLFTNTKNDLSLLKSLLGTSDLKYKAVADQLANEIMQCGFDYFNESQENNSSENYLESAQKLTKLADSIAVGKLTKDRAKDSLATLAEMKDIEISEAILLLKSVRDTYQSNQKKIFAQVIEQEKTLRYGQTINWTRVGESISNSIDWKKVIELIHKVIPRENIGKIKKCNNLSKINEYKELVEFLFDKIRYFQRSEINYICFWEVKTKKPYTKPSTKPYKPKPSSTRTSSGSSWAEENPGCIAALIIGAIIFFISILGS